MSRCMLLITNNPALNQAGHARLQVRLLEGTGLDVLCAARDNVHLGWRLLNHPLYGNFRPYHQPFRSIMLAPPAEEGALSVDNESLHLLEQAMAVYTSCINRLATPENVPQEMYADCSFIDVELMRATINSVP